MKKISVENRLENRKYLIAKMLQRYFQGRPNEERAHFRPFEFEKEPLLAERADLVRALNALKEDLKPDFQYELFFIDMGIGNVSEYKGVVASIDDRKRLDLYIAKIEKELQKVKKNEDREYFTLDEEAKLYLVGSKLPPYQMKAGRNVHKILFYLAKAKKPTTTENLAIVFEPTADKDKMRRKLIKIREEVSKKLKVSSDALIKNEPDKGYWTPTLTLTVPKGYTP